MKCAFIFLWLAVLSLGKTVVAQSLESDFASVCEENFEPTDRLLFMHRCAQVLFREMPGTVVRTGNVMYLDDWPDRIWPETLRSSYPWQSIRTDPMLDLTHQDLVLASIPALFRRPISFMEPATLECRGIRCFPTRASCLGTRSAVSGEPNGSLTDHSTNCSPLISLVCCQRECRECT